MRVEPVTREQFPVWKRLRQSVYSDLDAEFHDKEMAWLFASDQAAIFLAWTGDGEATGLLELSLRNFVDGCIGGPVGYVEGLYVEPKCRGRGHGRALLEFAARWCRAKGCTTLATDAEVDNDAAQAFFRRTGFAERWRTVGYTRALDDAWP